MMNTAVSQLTGRLKVMKLKRFVILVVAAVALALSASEVSAQLCARECDESGWYADTTVSGITYFGQTTWGLQCTDFGTEECTVCPENFEDCPGNSTNLTITNSESTWNEWYAEYGCCYGDEACYCPEQLREELIAKAVSLIKAHEYNELAHLIHRSDGLLHFNLDRRAIEAIGCDGTAALELSLDTTAFKALKSEQSTGDPPTPLSAVVGALVLGFLAVSRRFLKPA
jgi:hypothetical protein